MLKRNRRKSVPARSCTPTDVQQLEARALLTGTVTVDVTNSGDVRITGDSEDNDITVTLNEGSISVVGNDDTTIRYNKESMEDDTLDLEMDSNIRNLRINMKGGDDTVRVVAESDVVIDRSIDVNTGTGDDYFSLETDGSVVVVQRDVDVKTGTGNDIVEVFNSANLPADASADAFRDFEDDTDTAGNQSIQIGRDLDIRTGIGDDKIAVLGVEANRDVDVHSGLGKNDAVGISNVRAGRNMKLTLGDQAAIRNVTVGNNLKIKTGAGDDRVALENASARNIDVTLGTGHDKLLIGENVVWTGKAKFNGNAGTDSISSSSSLSGATVKNFENNEIDEDELIDEILTSLWS